MSASPPREQSIAAPEDDLARHRAALLLLARAQLARQRAGDLEASDLVQNTLLEAHRDRDRFRGHTDEERFAWLRRILHHNLLDAVEKGRAQRRDVGRKVVEADLTGSFAGLDELLMGDHTSPSQRLMHAELLDRLARALEQLPAQQREAVVLTHLAGWTLEQVGERLDCSQAGTAGLLFRGRQRLRELLED